jgi:hypothetical protein
VRTRTNTPLVAALCAACTLVVGFCLGWFLHQPKVAIAEAHPSELPESQRDTDGGPVKKHPPISQISQKTKQVDLDGGVKLSQITGESENGEVWLRTSFLSRNGEKVLMKGWDKCWGKNKTGRNLSQMYYHKDKMVLCEADQDGDGIFDLLILFDDAESPIQAFDVKKDGVLSPVGSDRLKKMKKDWGFGAEVIKPMVEGVKNGKTEQERQKAIEDAIKKAQEAGTQSP